MLGIIIALSIFIGLIVQSVTLNQNCTGYLKRAANANTVEIAKQELRTAIKYLEENNLTSGYTSILWKTPDEDIEFWYNNLKASEMELSKVDSTTSSLEKTNILMKLRETLIDNGDKGDRLTIPAGLYKYPYNLGWAILLTLSILACVGIIIRLVIIFDNEM